MRDWTPALRSETNRTIYEKLIFKAQAEGTVHLIIGVKTNFIPEGNLSQDLLSDQRYSIKTAQQNFLDRYASANRQSVKLFDYIPYLALETNAETLQQMQNDNLVTSIEEDLIGEAALAESVPMVGGTAAWNMGYTGTGQTVAIVDSGVDRTHSFLAGKVVSEACYSTNNSSSTSVCPGGATSSTATDSGLNCPVSVDGCAHGTHVAGIAAGKGASFSGVAKDANIIAVQIFSRFESTASCGSAAPCGRYWTSDLIKGLERVKTLSATINNIAAVNLSLQTGEKFTSNCDVNHAATKAAIDNLRSVGIPTIICAGNYSYTDALTAPACISTSISVGSVDDGSLGTSADAVSNFSDSSPLLNLLAPGRWISSSIPGGAYQNYSGTSMATPHVVGAFAILRQSRPQASITEMLNALTNTGLRVTDTKNSLAKPRIRIDLALQALLSARRNFDFDSDIKADLSVFRPSNSVWYLSQTTAGFAAVSSGNATDKLVPADFDGDGKTDIAVYHEGSWYITRSSDGQTAVTGFGLPDDVPVPADFDGDGKADISIYRPSNGVWYRLNSSTGAFVANGWGSSEDKPATGDFDGDGKADLCVYRPSNGVWYRLNSSNNQFVAIGFGSSGDLIVPADYDGDGKADIAVYRPSNNVWYRLNSTDNSFNAAGWGSGTDKPVPADYDGDGKVDIAVYRDGAWYIVQSSTNQIGYGNFGTAEDRPLANAYVR